jgi:integrase/recombinase XerD
VKRFCVWAVRAHVIPTNPAAELELPRQPQRLPRGILSASEMERVLALPDVATLMGLRDRAMLETLYSTGMRRQELIDLTLSDVDPERGTVLVREGKGKKDRLIPIGERALAWIETYLTRVRPRFAVPPDGGALFLTRRGRRLRSNRLTELVHGYLETAGLGARGSCHVFRHTMATLMLEGGADVRYIQEMLGHAQLNTTERYTRVAITQLKAVHARTHPARLTRSSSSSSLAAELQERENSATTPDSDALRARCGPPARPRPA